MRDLKLALLQTDLLWEAPAANRYMLENKLTGLDIDTDVVILPEMFTTGFTMNTALAEPEQGPSLEWMKEIALEKRVAIAGSIMVSDEGNVYNRMYFVYPEGVLARYDKRHLFRMAGEHAHFTPGQQRVVIQFRDWSICLQVCYDLRFPVWSRNRSDYDLLLYVANWPDKRSSAWSALLRARAIENYCYTAGVNRVGIDGNNIAYDGSSAIYDPKGATLAELPDGKDGLIYATLSAQDLIGYREKFPVWMDADDFSLTD